MEIFQQEPAIREAIRVSNVSIRETRELRYCGGPARGNVLKWNCIETVTLLISCYLDQFVRVRGFIVEHLLRQLAHDAVKFVRTVRRLNDPPAHNT